MNKYHIINYWSNTYLQKTRNSNVETPRCAIVKYLVTVWKAKFNAVRIYIYYDVGMFALKSPTKSAKSLVHRCRHLFSK